MTDNIAQYQVLTPFNSVKSVNNCCLQRSHISRWRRVLLGKRKFKYIAELTKPSRITTGTTGSMTRQGTKFCDAISVRVSVTTVTLSWQGSGSVMYNSLNCEALLTSHVIITADWKYSQSKEVRFNYPREKSVRFVFLRFSHDQL